MQVLFHFLEAGKSIFSGSRFVASGTRSNTGFTDDGENAGIAGAFDMGTAAKLDRKYFVLTVQCVVSHRYDSDFIAILLPKQRHCTELACRIDRHDFFLHWRVA